MHSSLYMLFMWHKGALWAEHCLCFCLIFCDKEGIGSIFMNDSSIFEQGCVNRVQCSNKLDAHNIKCL